MTFRFTTRKPAATARALCLLLLIPVALVHAAPRPNVVFILTDDQGAWAVGDGGHPGFRTPHLDRIHREGARLVNCFTTTPVCSPSRTTILTGRYGSELGITDWISPAENKAGLGVPPETACWVRSLHDAGYATALCGKWHLGEAEKYHPQAFGYDVFAGFLAGGCANMNPELMINGKLEKCTGCAEDIFTDHAIKFVRSRAGKEQPFALSLHFRAPHAPYAPVPEADGKPFAHMEPALPEPGHPDLADVRARKMLREYMASVAVVDRNAGRVLAVLDELKIADSTVVIFTSDHGYNIGQHGIWHKGNGHWLVKNPPAGSANITKGQAPNLYDTSLRVPCFIRWPGIIAPGSKVTHTVSFLDWFPTLLEMSGTPAPAGTKLRGYSITPLLRGEKPAAWRDDLYVEYSTKHQSKTTMRCWRTPRWKLKVDLLNEGQDQLFDLTADPGETQNLIAATGAEAVEARTELRAKIVARMKALGDKSD